MESALPNGTALDAGDLVFHAVFSAAKDDECHEVPILVMLPAELALHSAGERRAYPYSDPSFDATKATAHVAVALFAAASKIPATDASRGHIEALVHAARTPASSEGAGAELTQEMATLLRACQAFGERALNDKPMATDALEAFARDSGERILRLTHWATCAQIARLHAAFEAAQRSLSAGECAILQVVVIGDHQARIRSFGMQYFQRRFLETPGQDERLTYGENIQLEAEAIALVGTRQLDRRIARAFFGDEKRLQRDVLGDAAKACLNDLFGAK